ncbi:MAG: PorV/PorQ family protein, partial [bacterium]
MIIFKRVNRLVSTRARLSRYLIIAVCALGLTLPTAAAAADGDGGTQTLFSQLGAGSRGIALGGAYSALADDASALYWNPAALRNVQTKQVAFMYMPLFGDFTGATYTFLGGVYPTLNAGSFGLALMQVGTSFDAYDPSSRPLGEGDYADSQILIGYAFERSYRWLAGRLATGANFKIVNQKVDPNSSTAPGVDLGFRWIPNFAKSLAVGLNFKDLVGAEQKLNTDSDQTDRTIMAGIGYTRPFDNGSALRVMLQLDMPERADTRFLAGAEYIFSKYVSLRVGLDDQSFTFGLGVVAKGFGFDYAFLNRDTAGSSHPVTFSAQWGNSLDEQRAILAEQRAREDEEMIQRAFLSRVQSHRDAATQLEGEGNLPGAMDEWKIVLEFVPGDTEATEHIDALTKRLLEAQARAARDREKQATINAHFTQGLALYQENDYIRARAEWQAILAIDSTHTEAADYLARTQAKIDEALEGHRDRAMRLEQQQRYTEAISEWNNVQALDPGNITAQNAINRIRGKIEQQSQNLEQASKRLEVVNLYDSALQQFNQGNYERAMSDLEQLLKIDPNHQEARNLYTQAKRKLTPLTKDEEEQIRKLFLRGMQFFAKDQY